MIILLLFRILGLEREISLFVGSITMFGKVKRILVRVF